MVRRQSSTSSTASTPICHTPTDIFAASGSINSSDAVLPSSTPPNQLNRTASQHYQPQQQPPPQHHHHQHQTSAPAVPAYPLASKTRSHSRRYEKAVPAPPVPAHQGPNTGSRIRDSTARGKSQRHVSNANSSSSSLRAAWNNTDASGSSPSAAAAAAGNPPTPGSSSFHPLQTAAPPHSRTTPLASKVSDYIASSAGSRMFQNQHASISSEDDISEVGILSHS